MLSRVSADTLVDQATHVPYYRAEVTIPPNAQPGTLAALTADGAIPVGGDLGGDVFFSSEFHPPSPSPVELKCALRPRPLGADARHA